VGLAFSVVWVTGSPRGGLEGFSGSDGATGSTSAVIAK